MTKIKLNKTVTKNNARHFAGSAYFKFALPGILFGYGRRAIPKKI